MQIGYEQILNTYNNINKKIIDIEDNLKQMNKKVKSLSSSETWNGKGYNNYKEKFDEFIGYYIDFLTEVKQINSKLERVVNNYQSVDKEVMKSAQTGGF